MTIRAAAAEALQYVADAPVSLHGRVELLWYLREQSVSHVYHRYGNLGLRIDERRDEPVLSIVSAFHQHLNIVPRNQVAHSPRTRLDQPCQQWNREQSPDKANKKIRA